MHYLEAVAYARLDQISAATAIFRQLLTSDATRAQASFLLGQAFHDGHHLQEAVDSFNDVLRLDPGFSGARRERGKVYISMQRFSDAERDLRVAIEQDPQDGSAAYFLGALLIQIGKPNEGVPHLARAMRLLPDAWAIPFYLGKAELVSHHAERAVPLLQQAASSNADEPQVFYLLAEALRASGRPAEARAAMARVAALHSSALDAEKKVMEKRVAGAP